MRPSESLLRPSPLSTPGPPRRATPPWHPSPSRRRSLPATAIALALTFGAFPAPVQAQNADPADVASIDAIVAAVYDVISGEAGEARDWDRFRSLFADGATLSAVGRTPAGEIRRVVMTPDSYIERNGVFLERDGFFEKEIGRVTERYARIAHAFSSYESYRSASDAEPFARGINSFQFMNDGNRWWIVSIFWQGESPDFPIPAEYIGDIG
ncbi:MAG: hypothetical protein R3253_02735 [Longimicrobiales bacterium]|nr:hypothetical protein [Longimicrobiales bacterium]